MMSDNGQDSLTLNELRESISPLPSVESLTTQLAIANAKLEIAIAQRNFMAQQWLNLDAEVALKTNRKVS